MPLRPQVRPTSEADMARSQRTGSRRGYVDGVEPCLVGETGPQSASPDAVDPNEVFVSVGEVPYEWRLDSDHIVWGRNAPDVLGIRDASAIAMGARFAELVDAAEGQSRADVVTRSTLRDEGPGVPYQLQYALRPPGSKKPLRIEDTGRWFAGPDGKPARAHGVVRVINDRYEREQRLAYLSQYDALTGEMNRWRLTELLQAAIDEAVKLRSS